MLRQCTTNRTASGSRTPPVHTRERNATDCMLYSAQPAIRPDQVRLRLWITLPVSMLAARNLQAACLALVLGGAGGAMQPDNAVASSRARGSRRHRLDSTNPVVRRLGQEYGAHDLHCPRFCFRMYMCCALWPRKKHAFIEQGILP